jgi:Zn ribbon nucleic-acid-binding protein
LTFASKDLRCPSCKARDEAAAWHGKVEGEEYVTCRLCGHRAESLVSHIRSKHPEHEGQYEGDVISRRSAIRDKATLKGRTLSAETRAKMSASAGWNRGLTKEIDERVAHAAAAMKGRVPWSKGHTKADHPSLRSTSDKLSKITGAARSWSNGLAADLSNVDFTPYLDETGAVDRKTMAEELGLSEPTITKYMEAAGLRLSTRYVDARAERQTIRLERADLEKHTLGNGKVVIAQAMAALGRDFKVIKRECERHGLETFSHRLRQTLCLDAVSRALGGVAYEQEWSPRRFTNPSTGHRFRFDGFFPSHNLIVEFHGYQHYVFPSVYIKRDELYFALQERDRIKENMIHADPVLRYFLVREDEPYADPAYLRGRLMDEGVLDPGK